MANFVLDEGNTITVTAAGADKNGKPAPLVGPLTWVGDSAFATIAPTAGTNDCSFVYASAGLLTVICSGFASDGTTPISGTFTLQCNAAPPPMATHITFTASPEFITPVTP